ncbi:MAG: hypothetical protein OIF40_05230 [Mangrovicoccus sp.]|nr:hypothetical protein [Mangrovicoccus sp.]
MITKDDIVGMTDLTAAEVNAIAEHEHIPQVSAACLANYLLHSHKGPQRVQEMICDDIRAALHDDNLTHARQLYSTLHRFMSDHPEAAQGVS